MENSVYERLKSAIKKYKERIYNEEDLQNVLLSVANFITEYELADFRKSLIQIEGELEIIRFTTDKEKIHEKYLEIIAQLENEIVRIKNSLRK